ncbi:uncharacterized protein KY384_005311 [Bacidia gigantensis]|uniref:uncharacterized protein n=1 Tax=Bacidia gigantensis TaxID=2732470 RepID=UPI001D040F90|nr:uncharacterized protein KY384_005311 [Bacidia gigantensis]KAG8529830.1 hypothetical protein KY384_005311 [Bacidia gigantensis]
MAKTAVVTGATGFLGRQVLQVFSSAGWKAIGTGYSRANPPTLHKIDLSDADAVRSLLDEIKYDTLFHEHCNSHQLTTRWGAANRFPDKCDQDPDGARRINVEATQHLAQACNTHSALLIYISTDYVFPGRPGEAPYEVEADPEPTNLYGQTKRDGERAILEITQDTALGVILRVPVLYGKANQPSESAVNILLDAVWKAQENGAQVKMDHYAQRYPTNTEDVAHVCLDVAIKYLDAKDERQSLPKLLQFSSEDRHTKYEICKLLADIMGLPLAGMIAIGADPNASVQRPYDTHLSTKALQDVGISVRTQDFEAWWRREVKAYRK